MTDIHCHILPEIDDGSESPEDSLMMARLAEKSGTNAIIATPHCNLPGNIYDNYRSDELEEHFRYLCHALAAVGSRLKLYLGAEVFCTPDVPELLSRGKLLTLAGSRYLLTEFYFNEDPDYISEMLERIKAEGVIPVIAHPERYDCVQYDPHTAQHWFDNGCIIQANKGSVLGRFGRRSQAAANWLLTRGIVHIIGSDAHSPYSRTPDMYLIRRILAEDYGSDTAELLLETNPNNIITDKELIRV